MTWLLLLLSSSAFPGKKRDGGQARPDPASVAVARLPFSPLGGWLRLPVLQSTPLATIAVPLPRGAQRALTWRRVAMLRPLGARASHSTQQRATLVFGHRPTHRLKALRQQLSAALCSSPNITLHLHLRVDKQ